jgi:hypothetical protein
MRLAERPGRFLWLALALATMLLPASVSVAQATGPSAAPAWVPAPSDTWQYQLQGTIDMSVDADVFDVDAFDMSRDTVAALHADGRHVVCYVDAGSWEPYRPDKDEYPKSVIGRAVAGWPAERWLDIRRLDVLGPIIAARVARCGRKGFDGVEFDWVDSYAQNTGFDITKADSLRFDRWLAATAHAHGLAVGLKNALGLVRTLVDHYDFAVNEQCFQYQECTREQPFLDAGKAVFNVEYSLPRSAFCTRASTLGISSIRKHLDLIAWRRGC